MAAKIGQHVEVLNFRNARFAKRRVVGLPYDGDIPGDCVVAASDEHETRERFVFRKVAPILLLALIEHGECLRDFRYVAFAQFGDRQHLESKKKPRRKSVGAFYCIVCWDLRLLRVVSKIAPESA